MSSSPEHRRLRAAIRARVPDAPGVYRWLGRHGQAIYIGKSVRLRRRMLGYLGPPAALPPGVRTLRLGIHGFEVRETATELLALLLEDALIKRELPDHNERQAELAEFRWVVVSDDPFPALRVREEPCGPPARAYGPVRGAHFAADLVEIVSRAAGLRTCPDPTPHRRSARFDLGLCGGPCRGAIAPAAYAARVARAVALLEGDASAVVGGLRAEMERRAAALDFERATELRDWIARCERFAERQRFAADFSRGRVVLDGARDGHRYVFEAGRLLEVTRDDGRPLVAALPPELAEPLTDPRAAGDRAAIVQAWIAAGVAPAAPGGRTHGAPARPQG